MKKILLVPALLASSLLLAQDYNYEFTPVAGYNITEGNLDLSNQGIYGGEFQFNNTGMPISPELNFLYSNPDFKPSGNGGTDIYRVALNGVYEFNKISFLTPFVKAGFGYEAMSERQEGRTGNVSSFFLDEGAGTKISFTKNIALKLELVYMQKINDGRWDNNLALLAGINIAFGEKAQPAVEAPVVVAPVVIEAPKPQPIVEEKPVVAEVVAVVDGDDDHDGVKNSLDKCPNTPSTVTKVDAEGCTVVQNLEINFRTDSYKVDQACVANISTFATFLKSAPQYKVQIVGHTDITGSVKHNEILSLNRANSVRTMLVKDGVEADRVTAVGKASTEPVASNATKEGRAQNRRIEAILSK